MFWRKKFQPIEPPREPQMDVLAKMKAAYASTARQRNEAETLLDKLTEELCGISISGGFIVSESHHWTLWRRWCEWFNSEEKRGFYEVEGYCENKTEMPTKDLAEKEFWDRVREIIEWVESLLNKTDQQVEQRKKLIERLKAVLG